MPFTLFGKPSTNFRRWNYCFLGMVLLIAEVWYLINEATAADSQARGWGPELTFALLAAIVFVYWLFLLAHLCVALGLNPALWVVGSLLLGPFSIAAVHALMFYKVTSHFSAGRG